MKNPQHNTFQLPEGYRDLGLLWNKPILEITQCLEKKHQTKRFNNSLYLHGGDDNIYICDCCKIVWHIDSSD